MAEFGIVRRFGAGLRDSAQRLRRDEEGAVAIMTAATLLGAVVIIGGAIDVYRYEMLRKRAQNTLDRGVLAAASLNQTIDPETVVRSYMKSAGLELPAGTSVNVTEERGYRKIEVGTNFDMDLTFLRLVGDETWNVPVVASAEERERRVEISVILDLSGSMADNVSGQSVRRIDALKPAASNFVRQMLDTDKEKELTSISIVPYSTHVALGREMFDHLAGSSYKRKQQYSSCFHLTKADFDKPLPDFANRDQVLHWTRSFNGTSITHEGVATYKNNEWEPKNNKYNKKVNGKWVVDAEGWRCSPDAYAWLNRDPAKYVLTDGTDPLNETTDNPARPKLTDARYPSLEGGRKVTLWSKQVWNEVANCDRVDKKWAKADGDPTCGEPKNATVPDAVDREPRDALKDDDLVYVDDFGAITYLSNDPDYLAHRIDNMPLQGHTATHIGVKYASMLLDPAFRPKWSSFLSKKLAVGPKRPDNFNERPADFDDNRAMKYMIVMTDGRINQSYKSTTGKPYEYGPSGGETGVHYAGGNWDLFSDQCEKAKDNDIDVFTIGFDLGGSANKGVRDVLEKCASNRSNYFNVEDGDIDDAFDRIAASIQKLRLTS